MAAEQQAPASASSDDFKVSITELDPATGKATGYDADAWQKHALAQAKQPAEQPDQAAQSGALVEPTDEQQQAMTTAPADDAEESAQGAQGADEQAAEPEQPAAEEPKSAQPAQGAKTETPKGPTPAERAYAALQAENAALRAAQQDQGGMPEIKPDLTDPPDWEDEKQFPTDEAVEKARTAWFQERYQKAAEAALQAQQKARQELVQEHQNRVIAAEAKATHEEVRARMGLDQTAYAAEVAKLAAIVHPQWNEKFAARNPVGVVLADTRKQALNEAAAAGVDLSGYDTFADLHEAQVRDTALATKIAHLPITNETQALIEAAARQPKTVAVMKHLMSDAGAADLQRMLRPGTPPGVIHSEVYVLSTRIKPAAPAKAPAGQQTAPAGAPAATPDLASMQPNVPVLPTPGRTTPAPKRGKAGLDTPEGMEAEFLRRQQAADRNGTNGWRSY